MPKKRSDYDEHLIASLRDPGEAIAYLKAALDESDMPEVFLLALRQVAEAWGMQRVARKAKLNRESLYRLLSSAGNPTLASLCSILDALGLKLSVELKEAS